ncbi:MAG TPA: Na+/H+ antiporter [Chloroflexia bacterium]|nr:Na+/H+ antiporter [Chloroflexia bacterium]
MGLIEIVLGLLVVVVALVTIARKVGVPYPILLVLGGLALAVVPNLPRMELDPNIVLLLFLPPLVTAAAFDTSLRDLRANLGYIVLLAFGLVFFTMLVVAVVAHQAIGLAWAPAFVLGIVVSPTDAVAVTAVAQRLRVPPRIITILEGEGLLNDAATFVTYRVLVAAAVTGLFSWPAAGLQFVWSVIGGTVVGLGVGYVFAWVRTHLDDPPVEITISLLMPFAAYLAAEVLATSGIVATMAAGLYVGRRSSDPRFLSAGTRLQIRAIWGMMVFLLNGLAFILIGLQLPIIVAQLANRALPDLLRDALVISLTIILVRIVWAVPTAYLPHALGGAPRPTAKPAPPVPARAPGKLWREAAVIAWAGMRGVDSLAAALALPLLTAAGTAFPDRDLILFLTFCIILVTLVLQGLSLTPLIRLLRLKEDGGAEREEAKARLKSSRAGSARLEELAREDWLPEALLDDLRSHYAERIRHQSSTLDGTAARERQLAEEHTSAYRRAQRELLGAERQELIRLRNQGTINDEVLRAVQRDLDLEESLLGE